MKGREKMINAKQHSIDMLKTLPDNSTFEDILYSIYIRYKIELGLEDARNGRVISHEDLRKEVETWT